MSAGLSRLERNATQELPAAINIGARIPVKSVIGVVRAFFLSQAQRPSRNIFVTDKSYQTASSQPAC
jgi:hypothetical protein